MISDYSKTFIHALLEKQLEFFLVSSNEITVLKNHFEQAWQRTEYCFKHSTNKYYKRNGNTYFNPFHSGQWCIFLYYLSNSIWKSNEISGSICDKIYYLNKMLHSCDLFYEVELPDIFFLDHPLGAVMGRAKFGDYFTFSQGCTIGNNHGIFPVIGEYVTMLSDSKIIGRSHIGNNVVIAANSYVKDQDIPDNSIVFGSSPNLIIKKRVDSD